MASQTTISDRESHRKTEHEQRPLPSLSVVVPVYRSEAILPELVRRFEQTLPAIASTYELVLVNDCSPDNSWDVIRQLMQEYPWIRAINLMRNYGQHNALLCGIRAAQHDFIATMDDDLQHPPEEITNLIAILEQGFDVVYGRPAREQHGMLRDLASLTTKLALQSMMGAEIARQVSRFASFGPRSRMHSAIMKGRSFRLMCS